jgi:hypothetical protein
MKAYRNKDDDRPLVRRFWFAAARLAVRPALSEVPNVKRLKA